MDIDSLHTEQSYIDKPLHMYILRLTPCTWPVNKACTSPAVKHDTVEACCKSCLTELTNTGVYWKANILYQAAYGVWLSSMYLTPIEMDIKTYLEVL